MTDRTVPTEPTWEMQIAGRDAILSEDDTLDISTETLQGVENEGVFVPDEKTCGTCGKVIRPCPTLGTMCGCSPAALKYTPTPAGAGDLVERLRKEAHETKIGGPTWGDGSVMDEAASRIEALEAEVARLTRDNRDLQKIADDLGCAVQAHADEEARATTAEADLAALRAEVERKDKALREAGEAIQDFIQITKTQRPSLAHDTLNKVIAALAPAKAGG